jgi:pimeloyl-ACP methyl ester carboxylesterase
MIEKKEIIILLHGFSKSYRDMLPLSKNLKKLGCQTHSVNLPTTFKSMEGCYLALKEQLNVLKFADYDTVHLVGHSMGGLIIRYYLSKEIVSNLGRCVLIGTPNKGSRLADIADKVPFASKIIKPIAVLKSEADTIAPPLNQPSPEFGIIAGSDHRLVVTGAILEKPNDGRVEVQSTKMDKRLMKDFVILNFVHTKIQHEEVTAKLVDCFLENGWFSEKDDALSVKKMMSDC